jgi:hypothetical protein
MKKKPELTFMSAGDFDAHVDNWRIHPDEQATAVEGFIYGEEGVGWAETLTVNRRLQANGWATEGFVCLNGHLRQKIALAQPDTQVPVLIGEWTPEEEVKVLTLLDASTYFAETDVDKFQALIESFEFEAPDMREFHEAVENMFLGDEFDIPELEFVDDDVITLRVVAPNDRTATVLMNHLNNLGKKGVKWTRLGKK